MPDCRGGVDGLERLASGKVREVYAIPPGAGVARERGGVPGVALVASDRISAFDVVMPTPIPGKGALLTRISASWFRRIGASGVCPTAFWTDDAGVLADVAGSEVIGTWRDRVTIQRRCRVLGVECVVRGALEGSGWREYEATGRVCGVALPGGLRRCERLPSPIFTPATKAPSGEHDENITFDRMVAMLGEGPAVALRERALAVYAFGAAYAEARGIFIADTKFEFGVPLGADGSGWSDGTDGTDADGGPLLIDEVLTPDSSRFWSVEEWEPGRPQRGMDKQFLREFLESLVVSGTWDRSAPGPELPAAVVSGTVDRYRTVAERLGGA